MKFIILKSCLVVCLILQTGCDITFKRKSTDAESEMTKTEQNNSVKQSNESGSNSSENTQKPRRAFIERDIQLITLYYANEGNAQVLNDMIKHTWVKSQIDSKLTVGESIPADIQIMPLPLDLEKTLSPLSRYALRIQIGKRVILMDIKSRLILDVIKIK